MSLNPIIIKDLDHNMQTMEDMKLFLDRLYYNNEFATMFNKPVLSMMSSGCDFLIENFRRLKVQYLAKQG